MAKGAIIKAAGGSTGAALAVGAIEPLLNKGVEVYRIRDASRSRSEERRNKLAVAGIHAAEIVTPKALEALKDCWNSSQQTRRHSTEQHQMTERCAIRAAIRQGEIALAYRAIEVDGDTHRRETASREHANNKHLVAVMHGVIDGSQCVQALQITGGQR